MWRSLSWIIVFVVALASYGFSLGDVVDTVTSFFTGDPTVVGVSISEEEKAKQISHFNDVKVVDHSQSGLPKVRIGHRVVDLFHGMHFDDILMDTPNEARPPGVVVFYDSNDEKCMERYNELNFDTIAETRLPSRVRLMTARYNMYAAPRRTWYEFTPEMDLAKRFNVKSCPEVVFVPRSCTGHTEWCNRGPDPLDSTLNILGCSDFKEQCSNTVKWDGKDDYVKWIHKLVDEQGEPEIIPFLGSYVDQGRWIQKREYTTCTTHFRNSYLAQGFPAFTPRGFKAMKTPEPFQNWLVDFHKRHEHTRKTEGWHGESTQLSFHEVKTSFVNLDLERHEKERMAKKYLQPLVEEWSGMGELELTSFYGIREYHQGSWLRQHIDRIDTHVLSVTITVDKRNVPNGAKPWPLQVTDWTGQQVAYDHPAGTMILYESSKLPHGRPEPNFSGDHLGAFLHFKPVNLNSKDASKWDDIAKKARRNMNIHMEHATFKETPIIEPKHPVLTKSNYADESIWKEASSKTDSFSVDFKNEADRGLQVYWYHETQPDPIHQGTAWPGAKFEINTFAGHTFFWAELDSNQPIPGGKITIDPGKKVYSYNLAKDGTKAKVSKWSKVVKDKINQEERY